MAFTVVGTIYQAPEPDRLEVWDPGVIEVGDDGVITAAGPLDAAAALPAGDQVRLGRSQRLLPGLIDVHLHAPQWPQLGTGLDLPLEEWLFAYTFPLEARYREPAFAERVWEDLVPTVLAHGTTTAAYYATVDEGATAALAETCRRHGQRAFVGRVAMDHPDGTPPWYRDPDAATGVARSHRSIEAIRSIDGGAALVAPIVTPRFVPACTDALLAGLGELAAAEGVRTQTHCSESDWEHGYVLERYGRSDTEVLAELGLAARHSVLAHGDHMSDADFARAAGLGAGVAHCPLSNAYFAGAVFPLRRAMSAGVAVGLGSDVSGGAHPGLLHQAAMAVTASRFLEDGVDAARPSGERGVPGARVDTVTAFHAATVGGAAALGIPAGLLAPGRVFDAFVVDLDRPRSPLRWWDDLDDHARAFEKIVRLAGADDITSVWVDGRRVAGG